MNDTAVGTCRECGGALAASCLSDRKEHGLAVAQMARDGLTINTLPAEEVRAMKWGHVEGCSLKPKLKKRTKAKSTRSLFGE